MVELKLRNVDSEFYNSSQSVNTRRDAALPGPTPGVQTKRQHTTQCFFQEPLAVLKC